MDHFAKIQLGRPAFIIFLLQANFLELLANGNAPKSKMSQLDGISQISFFLRLLEIL
jgi:hypothetical protein